MDHPRSRILGFCEYIEVKKEGRKGRERERWAPEGCCFQVAHVLTRDRCGVTSVLASFLAVVIKSPTKQLKEEGAGFGSRFQVYHGRNLKHMVTLHQAGREP